MITVVFIAGMGLLFTALVIYCTRDLGRGRDPFAHFPVPGDGQSFGDMPPEIAHEEYLPAQLAACRATPPPPLHAAPTITLAPALPDVRPTIGGPSAGARAPEPPAGDEAPGPDGAPEGDEPAARPPQGTTGPGDLLAKATALVAALPVSDYLDEAGRTTAYADDAPWNPFSDATMTRLAAIKDEVAP